MLVVVTENDFKDEISAKSEKSEFRNIIDNSEAVSGSGISEKALQKGNGQQLFDIGDV